MGRIYANYTAVPYTMRMALIMIIFFIVSVALITCTVYIETRVNGGSMYTPKGRISSAY